MPLGMKVGLNPGDSVLDGDSAPLLTKAEFPCVAAEIKPGAYSELSPRSLKIHILGLLQIYRNLHGVYTRRSPRRSHRVNKHATATVHVQPYMRQQFRPRLHVLNMFNFVRSNVRLSHRLCKFQPITDQRNATQAMAFVWTMDILSKLINIVKNYPVV